MFYQDVERIAELIRAKYPKVEVEIGRQCRQYPETDPTIIIYFRDLDKAISVGADDTTGEDGTNVVCCSHNNWKSDYYKPNGETYESLPYTGVDATLIQIDQAINAVLTEIQRFENECDAADREWGTEYNPEFLSGERRRALILKEYIS